MQNATAACNEVENGFSNKGTVLENRWTATVVLYGGDDGADSMYNNPIYCREDLVEPESSPLNYEDVIKNLRIGFAEIIEADEEDFMDAHEDLVDAVKPASLQKNALKCSYQVQTGSTTF
jgi:hypothetical protein